MLKQILKCKGLPWKTLDAVFFFSKWHWGLTINSAHLFEKGCVDGYSAVFFFILSMCSSFGLSAVFSLPTLGLVVAQEAPEQIS